MRTTASRVAQGASPPGRVVTRTLVVEGWRTSPHSYALVNQYQLLHLIKQAPFQIFHRDAPFKLPHWAQLDSGLTVEEKSVLAAIPAPPPDTRPDATYRISFPLRLCAGAGRVLVFGTSEFGRLRPNDVVGADGTRRSARPDEVEVVTPSEWSKRGFVTSEFAEARVHVIPHGVEPAQVALSGDRRNALRQSLGIPEGAFAWLNVSCMTWNKGIGPLLAAFAAHRRKEPRSILVLKGGDELYGNLLQRAFDEAIQIEPNVCDKEIIESIRYLPQNFSRAELSDLYQAVDAYVAPYRAEAFNLPVLEAMAAGLPVVVTGGGPTAEFCPPDLAFEVEADLVSGAAEEYLEPRVASLIEQMNRVVGDPARRAAVAARARAHAHENYSWARAARKLRALVEAT